MLAHEKDHEALMSSLQDLGVLHLEKKKDEENEELEHAIHYRNTLLSIIKRLDRFSESILAGKPPEKPINQVVKEILSLEEKIDHLALQNEADQKEYEKLQLWGDYTYQQFQPLTDRGYRVYLCSTTKKAFETLDLSDFYYQEVNRVQQEVYFVVFSREKELSIPVEFFQLPKKSPADLEARIKETQAEIATLEEQLKAYKPYLSDLQKAHLQATDQVELLEARHSSSLLAGGNLVHIEGWFPDHQEKDVLAFLEIEKTAYYIRPPETDEDVPVLLKNPGYTRLFEPITRIFELPNYYEADLTPFIAVFYPILFAYCLGDAGYGFVLAAMMLGGFFTFLKEQKSVAILGFILGVFTMVMGLVKSGSLFGIMLVEGHEYAWISYLSQFVYIPDDSEFLFNAFNVALMIGVVQIIVGVIISIYNKAKYEKSLVAISAVGKLFIVVALIWIFLADMQNMTQLSPYSNVRTALLIVGILLVVFFHQTDTPIGKRAASSVMPLFFIFTGILGDILSYVRLFALGLASSVLGLVVNQIGQQIMEGNWLSFALGILFLIFGHTLNFGIAALGSFVHPLRLTFVEFYGNADFKGKGVTYKPFSKSIKSLHNA